MLAMMFSPAFVRSLPGFLKWARDVSFIGLLSEMAMYLEFQTVDTVFEDAMITTDFVLETYGVNVRSDEDFLGAAWVLVGTWVVARVIAYLAVKYLHTGRSIGDLCAEG